MKKLFKIPTIVTILIVLITVFSCSYPINATELSGIPLNYDYNDIFDYDYENDSNDDYDDIFDYDYSTKSNNDDIFNYDYSTKSNSDNLLTNIISNSNLSIYTLLDILTKQIGTTFLTILLIISLIWCFAGFKIFKIFIAICGFFIGGIIGFLGAYIISDDPKVTFCFFVSLIFSILCAILSYKIYALGVFFTGLLNTLPIGTIVMYLITQNFEKSIIIAIILGMIIGIVMVIFKKPVIIVSTAVQYGLQAGVYLACIISNTRLSGLLGIIIAIIGVIIQMKTNNGLLENNKNEVSSTN